MAGPLEGIRIVELAGIGPGPFCAMMLADAGAEVIRVERPSSDGLLTGGLNRSRKILTLDLKSAADIATLKALVKTADGLIEGFRPGTIERLGIGPHVLHGINPRLVIGRMTGWGQTGPYAKWAGHDINYISLSGALHATGPEERPIAPPAMLGDFGGGGMMLAFGMTAAMLKARETGQGQVIDAAMTEGSALLMTAFYSGVGEGNWHDRRGANIIDGGAHFYGAYKTSDGKFVSIGSIEPQFYALLLDTLGLSDDADFKAQLDQQRWPALKERMAAIIATKTRDEWCAIMEQTDICFAPVLGMTEAPHHAHSQAREAFVEVGGIMQPAPAPRYSGTPLAAPRVSETITASDLGLDAAGEGRMAETAPA